MRDLKPTCRVAVVQAAPVLFDTAAGLEKALGLIRKAAESGAELAVFPELFLPCYPYGMTFGFTVGHREEGGGRTGSAITTTPSSCPGRRPRPSPPRPGRPGSG